jgi:hypothetical protein
MWTVLAACLFAVGPALVWLSPRLAGGDGGPGWTFLANDAPTMGALVLIVTVAVAVVCGVVASRFLGLRAGLGAVGMTLVAPALQGGEIVEVLRWAEAPGIFVRLALEGAIVAGLGFVGAFLMTRVALRDDPMSPAERKERTKGHLNEGLIGLAAALSVGAVAGWVLAREPLKGQMLAAGFAAGSAGMGAARVIAPRAPIPAVVLGVLLLGVVGPVLGYLSAGSDALAAAYEQRLPAIATLTPIDWLTGALLGMPLGLSWSLSVLEKRAEKHGQAAPA